MPDTIRQAVGHWTLIGEGYDVKDLDALTLRIMLLWEQVQELESKLLQEEKPSPREDTRNA